MRRKFMVRWTRLCRGASGRLAGIGVLVAMALLASRPDASAQMPSASLPGVDPALLEHDEIYFNAARLDRSLALKTSDYAAIALPRLAHISSAMADTTA